MGKAIRKVVIIFIFSASLIPAYTQFTPASVEKSKQKILFQGKVYFIHTVKRGQTLYSISRAYGVTEQDIANANPNVLLEVINPGQALRIPENSALSDLSESYFGLSEQDFIFHTIRSQQTLYYLSRKYNVPEELIVKYNPGCDEVLQIGQTIKIPKKGVLEQSITAQKEYQDSSGTFKVKEGDTLYSLAKKYRVSVADLIELNPELRWGLKAGMTLKIPGHFPFDFPYSLSEVDSGVHTPKIKLFNNNQCDSIKLVNNEQSIKIALLLPFHAYEILTLDTLSNDSIKKVHPYNRFKKMGKSLLNYYEGLLLAIDSIKKTGINITLHTFDTQSDSNKVKRILPELDIIDPNLIIGPVMPFNIDLVAEFSKNNEIPLILPLSKYSSRINYKNPYSIYLLPDIETEYNLFAKFIAKYHKENLILIQKPDSISTRKVSSFKDAIFSNLASNSVYETTQYKEFIINDSLQIFINHAIRDDVKNVFIIFTDDEADVINILSKLNLLPEGIDIQILGLPSWQTYTNLQLELLHKLNTVVYTPFYIDYSKMQTKRLVYSARKTLNAEPYRTVSGGSGFSMSYLGYETGMVFIKAFSNYGKEFINCLCNIEDEQPQTKYTFKHIPANGFTNNTVNFIQYSTDYEIKTIAKESFDFQKVPGTDVYIRNAFRTKDN